MPTVLPAPPRSAPAAEPFAGSMGSLAGLLRRWRLWNERYRQRRDLAELDDHLLDDIGVSRRRADQECSKPPWH